MSKPPLWEIKDILAATNGMLHGNPADTAITHISIDSRAVQKGDLFIAIKGENNDGHDYLKQAFDRAAAAALAHKDADSAYPLIIVPDTMAALNRLAAAARARTSGKMIAITGSVGKTSTKEALRLCLSGQGRTHASVASYNNRWGLPLSLARMPADTDFGIFEIGMNHAGEIAPLTRLTRPDIAIITTIDPVHIGHFDSLEQIAAAKAEIFDGLQPGGTAILNRDNEFFEYLVEKAKTAGVENIIAFGTQSKASARAIAIDLQADHSEVQADILGTEVSYKISVPGRHLVINSLAVLAGVHAAGGDIVQASEAFAALTAFKGRGARCEINTAFGPLTVIDESYNASPVSVRAALKTLGQNTAHPRRIAVLGDMRELGEHSDALHAGLAETANSGCVDQIFACGPHMKALWDKINPDLKGQYTENSTALASLLPSCLQAGDIIMVKGSLGSHMAVIIECLLALKKNNNAKEA